MLRTLLVAAAVLAPSAAHADRTLGVTVDAGVPDGAAASIVYRPISQFRFHAGATHNMITTGVRAGVSIVPLRSWFSPTLNVDAGSYAEGDANPLVQMVSGNSELHNDQLERVGYRYANAHLGLEFGRQRATFYLHAGGSYIAGKIRNLNAASDGSSSTTVSFTTDPDVRLLTVSAKLGLIIYFL